MNELQAASFSWYTPCAACGMPSRGNYSIHENQWAFDNGGPEVWLCDGCGQDEYPSVPQLWANIWMRKENNLQHVPWRVQKHLFFYGVHTI